MASPCTARWPCATSPATLSDQAVQLNRPVRQVWRRSLRVRGRVERPCPSAVRCVRRWARSATFVTGFRTHGRGMPPDLSGIAPVGAIDDASVGAPDCPVWAHGASFWRPQVSSSLRVRTPAAMRHTLGDTSLAKDRFEGVVCVTHGTGGRPQRADQDAAIGLRGLQPPPNAVRVGMLRRARTGGEVQRRHR